MRLLSHDDLRARGISYSRTQLWRLEKTQKFPKRVALSTQRVGWIEHEIDQWLEQKAAAREAA
jgi:prophage regulatory protein